jgi:crossover junction endodeoxyribonuclease RusA
VAANGGGTVSPIIIVLSIPDKALSPNGRAHYMVKARAVKKARDTARWVAWETWQRVAPRHDAPRWTRARIDVAAYWKDRRSIRDDDNLWGSLKASRDGIADAGLVENDRCFEMGMVDQGVDAGEPRIVVTVTQLPTGKGA